ncbi:MAG: ECF-type sigma factor, partial [Pseudomonadota bacterium]
RQIIIDHYRRRTSQKRTKNPNRFNEYETRRVTPDMDAALVELGRTLSALKQRDPELLQVFELRFLVGMNAPDVAREMKLSERTVQRMAARARAWVANGLGASS